MKFRTDISFLRALSVLMVMLFHFQIPGVPGGFIGVDVFFVISGFLMTMIVLREFDKNTFSLKNFFIRRIRRLVPALVVMLIFILLISIIFFFEADLRRNAKYVVLSDFFVSNIYFWKYQHYFSSKDNILLHTWTLGVEWQFYLIYPIILLSLRKVYSNNKILFWSLLTGLSILSIVIMLNFGNGNTNFIFYMLPSRYWELSIGGLAYGLGHYLKPTNLLKKIIVIFSIILIFASAAQISESDLWPSWITLVPVLATCAILIFNAELSIFDFPFFRFFGNISYSLYLWHWPWFILFKYFGFIGWSSIIIVIFLSIASAYLSYKFVENNNKLATVKFSAISTVLVGTIALVLFIKPSLVQNLSIYQSDRFKIGNYKNFYISSGQKDVQFDVQGCTLSGNQTIVDFNFTDCLKFESSRKNVLLMGDSHAAQFSSSLRNFSDYNVLQVNVGNAFPLINSRGQSALVELNNFMYGDFIPKNKDKIDLVLISAHWQMAKSPHINYSTEDIALKINETIQFFERNHIKYLIIGQTESYLLDFPKILMLEELGRARSQYIDNEAKIYNEKISSVVPASNYIDIYRTTQISQFDQINNIPYMFDTNHLTQYGADQIFKKLIIKRIDKAILDSKY